MNLKDPKNQIIAVIVIVFLAVVYLWYSQVFAVYNDKIDKKEVERGKMLNNVHQVRQKAATLNDLQKELEDLQMKYEKVQLLLPERKEDESFLTQLHAAAQLTGSIIQDITPLGTQSGEFYLTNSYSVEVQSTFHALGSFFAKVANFPFIVNISDLQLKSAAATLAAPSDTKKDDDKIVTATFKLLTYNVKQGVAE